MLWALAGGCRPKRSMARKAGVPIGLHWKSSPSTLRPDRRPTGPRTGGPRTSRTMSDWDASRYHRVSEPQFDWGQRVIARLMPVAGERILDLGCGTGRLTQEIQRASTGGPARVVGLDRSGSMLAVARASIPHAEPAAPVLLVHA